MAEISAQQVQALRTKTGLAMMDCKKALVEAGGDPGKALDCLRRRFADKMSDRADKEAANGRIGVYADDRGAALIELRCETDFVATNDNFKALANAIAGACAASGVTDPAEVEACKAGAGRTVKELLVDAYGQLKEKIVVKRIKRLEGPGACYVHHNGKVGAAIVCDKPPGEAGRQVCMHIASMASLMALSREQLPAERVAPVRAKVEDEAAATGKGKPPQVLQKIVDGKMDKWYAERVLLEQPFVMDDKKSVGQFAMQSGFVVKAYLKFEVGGVD
jgi:elongation factor Ts